METIDLSTKINDTMSSTEGKPSILNLLKCKCPRCRRGDMFQDSNPWHLKNTMKMNKECALCHQQLDIEVGFYFGSSYVSYALSVALSVCTFVAWWILIGISYQNNNFFYWMGLNAVLLILVQPYLMRLARTGWLAFFARYDKNWATNPPKPLERTNKDQENNW